MLLTMRMLFRKRPFEFLIWFEFCFRCIHTGPTTGVMSFRQILMTFYDNIFSFFDNLIVTAITLTANEYDRWLNRLSYHSWLLFQDVFSNNKLPFQYRAVIQSYYGLRDHHTFLPSSAYGTLLEDKSRNPELSTICMDRWWFGLPRAAGMGLKPNRTTYEDCTTQCMQVWIFIFKIVMTTRLLMYNLFTFATTI